MSGKAMTNLKDLVKEYANDIIEAVQDNMNLPMRWRKEHER